MKTNYPIYIPTKGRYDTMLSAKFFIGDKTPINLVVEKQEKDKYIEAVRKIPNGEKYCRVLTLPFVNRGVVTSRNWIWEHSIEEGHKRHWNIDDNIRQIRRWYKEKRLKCNSGQALSITEEFVDRYENIGVAGLNYKMFCVPGTYRPPFNLNVHVYSCTLIWNELPFRWRGFYNEDTDLCLQVLAHGWCTVLFNAFMIDKIRTMTVKGGNSPNYNADGRLHMSRELERRWPGVVRTDRKYDRPQHHVIGNWTKFDNKLIRRSDIDWEAIEKKEYKFKLKQIGDDVKSPELRALLDEHG